MVKINAGKIQSTTLFDGFKNYEAVPFGISIAAQNLGAGDVITATATTQLNNANSVSQVQVQYLGVQSAYLILTGSNFQLFGGGNYEIQPQYFFNGTTLTINFYIVNQTGGTISIPQITFNCKAFLFIAPF